MLCALAHLVRELWVVVSKRHIRLRRRAYTTNRITWKVNMVSKPLVTGERILYHMAPAELPREGVNLRHAINTTACQQLNRQPLNTPCPNCALCGWAGFSVRPIALASKFVGQLSYGGSFIRRELGFFAKTVRFLLLSAQYRHTHTWRMMRAKTSNHPYTHHHSGHILRVFVCISLYVSIFQLRAVAICISLSMYIYTYIQALTVPQARAHRRRWLPSH